MLVTFLVYFTELKLGLRLRPRVELYLFEKAKFSLRIAVMSTRIRSPKTLLFEIASWNGNFSKRRFPILVGMDESGTSQKRLRHGIVSCARFKKTHHCSVAFGWVFPSLTVYLEINLALLNVQADYRRRRFNIIKLLSIQILNSSQKRLDRE